MPARLTVPLREVRPRMVSARDGRASPAVPPVLPPRLPRVPRAVYRKRHPSLPPATYIRAATVLRQRASTDESTVSRPSSPWSLPASSCNLPRSTSLARLPRPGCPGVAHPLLVAALLRAEGPASPNNPPQSSSSTVLIPVLVQLAFVPLCDT